MTAPTTLRELQKAFTEHLRDPDHVPVPPGLDQRRVGIYSDLIFNNVSSLLSDFFPVIHSILPPAAWDAMVRDFFISHESQTPYFPALSGEFANYLAARQLPGGLPQFLPELAHYEWIELALYTMEAEPPEAAIAVDALGTHPIRLSPLAVPLAYLYPVHQISPDFQPIAPGDEPVFILVIRDLEEQIRFFELQALSFQLLNHIQENPGLIVQDWLKQLAGQAGIEEKSVFVRNGLALLQSFNEHRIFIQD